MANNMTQFRLLAERDISKTWNEQERELEANYTKVVNVDSFDGHLYKRELKMGGFGGLIQIDEDAPTIYQDALSPVAKRVDWTTRGTGYKITRRLWENDEYGQVKKMDGSLQRAVRADVEQQAFGIYNSATATTYTGFDGLALSSTAHTRLDGGAVQANRPSSFSALSLASLKDGIVAFRKFKDERGRPYRSEPTKLLIHPDLIFTANEILGSPDRPDTANRAVNSLRMGTSLQIVSSLYLTSTTFAALIGNDCDVRWIWRNRPVTEMAEDFETKTIKRTVYYDAAPAFFEWKDFYQLNS